MTVFWVVVPCSLVEVYWHSGVLAASIIRVMSKLCARNRFETWELVGQGRASTRPVGKRVRIGWEQGSQWEKGRPQPGQKGGEDRCSSDMQGRDHPILTLFPTGPAKVLPCLTGSQLTDRFLACSLLTIPMMKAASTSGTSVNFYQTKDTTTQTTVSAIYLFVKIT
jgi:hypothetical protein